jgi:hypothetical protein
VKLIRWVLIWLVLTVGLTGLIAYGFSKGDFLIWKAYLRAAGGVYFFIALMAGGVLTTEVAYRERTKPYYREEWSFICILVTISLFGISLLFP